MNMLLRRHHAVTQDARTDTTPAEVSDTELEDVVAEQAERERQAAAEREASDLTEEAKREAEEEAARKAEAERVAADDGTDQGTAHGDLERPDRNSSTAAWVAYAQADPNGAPFSLEPRTGLRDDLAGHYLGTE